MSEGIELNGVNLNNISDAALIAGSEIELNDWMVWDIDTYIVLNRLRNFEMFFFHVDEIIKHCTHGQRGGFEQRITAQNLQTKK